MYARCHFCAEQLAIICGKVFYFIFHFVRILSFNQLNNFIVFMPLTHCTPFHSGSFVSHFSHTTSFCLRALTLTSIRSLIQVE